MNSDFIVIPKRGQYLLIEPWEVDLYNQYDENGNPDMTLDEYSRWKLYNIDPWIIKGATQTDRTKILFPRDACLTLDLVKLTPYHNSVVFKLFRKYNNVVKNGRLDLTIEQVQNFIAVYLDRENSERYANYVRLHKESEFTLV